MIGASNLRELAADLENAGRDGSIPERGDDLKKLLSSYKELADKLSPLFETHDEGAELPLISSEELHQVYEKLLLACSEYDYDTIVSTIDELSLYRIPDDEKTRVDAIRCASDDLDYDVIPEIISEGGREGQDVK